jgi:holo-[acyl-carrier protein] synthase
VVVVTVVGVGLELVDVAGFAARLDAPGSRITTAVFTEGERRAARGDVERLAARWAAKRAAASAVDADPADVEVVLDPAGRPGLAFHGDTAATLERRHPGGVRTHVSLSHDGGVAAALVVVEATGPQPDGSRPPAA